MASGLKLFLEQEVNAVFCRAGTLTLVLTLLLNPSLAEKCMLEPSLNLTSISEQVFFFLYTSSLKVDPSRCFQMSGGNYKNVAFDIILGVSFISDPSK